MAQNDLVKQWCLVAALAALSANACSSSTPGATGTGAQGGANSAGNAAVSGTGGAPVAGTGGGSAGAAIGGNPSAGSGTGGVAGTPAGGAGGTLNPPGDDLPPNAVQTQSPWTINSPDGKVIVTLALSASDQSLSYAVAYDGSPVILASAIGIDTSAANFGSGLAYVSGSTKVVDETYTIPTGKRSSYHNHANELTLKFTRNGQEIDLVTRAYDEGGAYRFAIPGSGALTVNGETGGSKLQSGSVGFAADTAADYQGQWDSRTESQLNSGEWEYPVLVKAPNSTWALLTEAAIYSNYFASHARGSSQGDGVLELAAGQGSVATTRPFATPWRVAMVGKSLSTIVESTITENLNPPSEISDTSWIKSGRSAWSWWSGDSTSDYDTQVQYVDFAASMGWEYYLADEGWQDSWMPKLVTYAAGKGVGIWLWISGDNMNTDAKIQARIPLWASWGIKGIKVDYVFGDSTTELTVYDKVALAAAQYKLMVNYHGCTKPSGERRRWPHLMTREAVYGAEQYKGGTGPTAKFNAILPFTRNVQGPMDYTPVTYSDHGNMTTNAHQTALDIVFESGVQHLADKPASYTANIAKDLLKAVPSAWDEIKLIEGDPGNFATIARRKDKDWYIGSIAGGDARTATIPLGFLGAGNYSADIYRDGNSDTEQVKEQQSVTSGSTLSIAIRKHGGCAIRITPQ